MVRRESKRNRRRNARLGDYTNVKNLTNRAKMRGGIRL